MRVQRLRSVLAQVFTSYDRYLAPRSTVV